MTTQTIYRTTHTSNFTVLPNAIWSAGLSAAATSALIYLLSHPPTWKVRITDLRNRLSIGRDKVYKALNELVRAGYAKMTRLQRGVLWQFFDTPQIVETSDTKKPTPNSRLPDFQFTEHQEALKKNEIPLVKNQKKQQQATTVTVDEKITEAPPVVVSIELPESIPPKDRAACKAILSKEEEEIQKEALFALAYAITHCQVRSTPAYLTELVKATKEKRLTKPPVTTPKPQKYWTPPEPTPVDNMEYYRDLWRKYGDSVLQYIPEQYKPKPETG